MGLWLKQAAHGMDFSEIEESEEAVKLISRNGTFKENTNDSIKIAGYLEMLAESVHKSLVKH
jgi:DNA polymerase IV (archaeal DinB-like DNA polymerase)